MASVGQRKKYFIRLLIVLFCHFRYPISEKSDVFILSKEKRGEMQPLYRKKSAHCWQRLQCEINCKSFIVVVERDFRPRIWGKNLIKLNKSRKTLFFMTSALQVTSLRTICKVAVISDQKVSHQLLRLANNENAMLRANWQLLRMGDGNWAQFGKHGQFALLVSYLLSADVIVYQICTVTINLTSS